MAYNDLDTMIQDISEYIKTHHGKVLSADDPMRRMVGFCLKFNVRKLWEINLTTIKKYNGPLRSKFATAKGRIELAEELSSNCPDTCDICTINFVLDE